MIDHRNPYNLYKMTEGGVSYLVLPYDLSSTYWSDANNKCNELTAFDYSDWTLPQLIILKLMYQNKNEIGGFSDEPYWSSSYIGYTNYIGGWHYSTDYYLYSTINFYDGDEDYGIDADSDIKYAHNGNPGSSIYNVRPVRQYYLAMYRLIAYIFVPAIIPINEYSTPSYAYGAGVQIKF